MFDPQFEVLKEKQRAIRAGFPETMGLARAPRNQLDRSG